MGFVLSPEVRFRQSELPIFRSSPGFQPQYRSSHDAGKAYNLRVRQAPQNAWIYANKFHEESGYTGEKQIKSENAPGWRRRSSFCFSAGFFA